MIYSRGSPDFQAHFFRTSTGPKYSAEASRLVVPARQRTQMNALLDVPGLHRARKCVQKCSETGVAESAYTITRNEIE